MRRMGYGAMQLAGKGVFGPPKDRAGAIAVLREALDGAIAKFERSGFADVDHGGISSRSTVHMVCKGAGDNAMQSAQPVRQCEQCLGRPALCKANPNVRVRA